MNLLEYLGDDRRIGPIHPGLQYHPPFSTAGYTTTVKGSVQKVPTLSQFPWTQRCLPGSKEFLECKRLIGKGCIGVVQYELGLFDPLHDPYTKCFMFKGEPHEALKRAQEYAATLKCPSGKDARIWAVNFAWCPNVHCVASQNPVTGEISLICMPTSGYGKCAFDCAISQKNTCQCRWTGATGGACNDEELPGESIIYWHCFCCFVSTWGWEFDTTMVCVSCPK